MKTTQHVNASGKASKAPTPLVFVTAGGEVFKGGDLVTGSIDLGALKGRLGREPTPADCDAEFELLTLAAVGEANLGFVKSVWRLQAVDDGRFRVYGGLWDDGPMIQLATEFIAFADDLAFWHWLRHVALRLNGAVFDMRVAPHVARGKRAGADWRDGPDHGRVERQVELVRDVTYASLAHLYNIRDAVRDATDPKWGEYGVGVI